MFLHAAALYLYSILAISLTALGLIIKENDIPLFSEVLECLGKSPFYSAIITITTFYLISSLIIKLWSKHVINQNLILFINLLLLYIFFSQPANLLELLSYSTTNIDLLVNLLQFTVLGACTIFLVMHISQAISHIFQPQSESVTINLAYQICFLLVTLIVISLIAKFLGAPLVTIFKEIF